MRRRKSRRSVIRNMNYFIGEAFGSIMRNKLMSVSSVATIASCVFIVVFSICLAINVSFVFRQLEDQTGVVVWLNPDLEREGISALRAMINDIEFVQNVVFVTADEGLSQFIERQGDEGARFERVRGNNPIRNSFEVELTNTRRMGEVAAAISELYGYGAQQVDQPSDVLDIFVMLNTVIRAVSVVVVLVLGVLSVVIVVNTIKLTVNNRRNEISIMKYVGATDMFVRWPFIIEGMLIGLLGAAVPVAIVWAAYNGAVDMVYGSLAFLEDMMTLRAASEIFPLLAPAALFIGAAIGTTGSAVSIRRYLQA